MSPIVTQARWLRAVLLASFGYGALGSLASAQPVGERVAPLVYGEDGRHDLCELADDHPARATALESTLALVPADALQPGEGGRLRVLGEPLGELFHLCEAEPFRQQPSAALCSGVLVDAALVLTAGHCAERARCADQRWVFGYALEAPGEPLSVRLEDVHGCRAVVLAAREELDGRRHDYAFVELDRPVTARHSPPTLRGSRLEPGEAMHVIGHPNGLPVKVATGARVLDARSGVGDFFTLSSDTFDGNSGSGVFDAYGRLAGVFVRGGRDYDYRTEAGCFATRRISASVDPSRAEQASYVGVALATLCAREPSRAALCERLARAQQVSWGCAALSGRDPRMSWSLFALLGGWLAQRRRRRA